MEHKNSTLLQRIQSLVNHLPHRLFTIHLETDISRVNPSSCEKGRLPIRGPKSFSTSPFFSRARSSSIVEMPSFL
jgi:hypothetical protein